MVSPFRPKSPSAQRIGDRWLSKADRSILAPTRGCLNDARDGDKVATLTAREPSGGGREHWRQLAVAAYPPYAEYQTKTDRLIPVFALE